MEHIRTESIKIYPNFWCDYAKSLKFISTAGELEELINLYVFLVEYTNNIFITNCVEYKPILASMSILSLWSIEFNSYLLQFYRSGESTDIMKEILEFSNIERSLSDQNINDLLLVESRCNSVYTSHISYVKEKMNKLYLKLIC